ncbi:MAG: type II toxin-antitoxin system VapC family toxin [Nanoarchaeota archaeon]
MIYLDTNIFIYAIIDETEIGNKCREIIKNHINEKKDASTSCLTWDEVVYGIRKKIGKENSILQGKNLIETQNLVWLKTEETIIFKAQELMENYSLKPRDAIHAATAINNGIKEIISDDPDFDKVKELKRISP